MVEERGTGWENLWEVNKRPTTNSAKTEPCHLNQPESVVSELALESLSGREPDWIPLEQITSRYIKQAKKPGKRQAMKFR